MKKTLSLLICVTIVMSLFLTVPFTVNAAITNSGGSGTEQDPYQLYEKDLQSFQGQYMGTNGKTIYYKLMEPATLTSAIKGFYSGSVVFDGNHQTVDLDFSKETEYATGNSMKGNGMFASAQLDSTDYTITIKDLTITGDVVGKSTNTAYNTCGGLIGFVQNTNLDIINVRNFANVTVTNDNNVTHVSAGGIIGGIYSSGKYSTKITNCYNHGTISSTSRAAAGIIGYVWDCKTATEGHVHYEIEKCGNYGEITSDSGFACGILFGNSYTGNTVINACFNAGPLNAKGSNAYAIAYMNTFYVDATTGARNKGLITNCFNAGTLTGKSAAASYFASTPFIDAVSNCYNAGATGNLNSEHANYPFVNTYYLDGTVVNTGSTGQGAATKLTTDELDGPILPEGFSSEVWEYLKGSDYIYPQLKGNTYMDGKALPETLTAEATSFIPPEAETISETFAGDKEVNFTGKYIAAFATAPSYAGYSKTFGMKIEKDGTEETADAVPGSDKDGKYGMLFYGSKLTTGEYKITPFVTYTAFDGTEVKTIFGAETTVNFTE